MEKKYEKKGEEEKEIPREKLDTLFPLYEPHYSETRLMDEIVAVVNKKLQQLGIYPRLIKWADSPRCFVRIPYGLDSKLIYYLDTTTPIKIQCTEFNKESKEVTFFFVINGKEYYDVVSNISVKHGHMRQA